MRINDFEKKQTVNEIDVVGAVKGAVQGFQQSQQKRQVAQNTKMLARAALRQWNTKVLQLTQAAQGQPVDPTEYENQLADFVERVLLRGTSILDLEPQSKQKIEQAIGAVVTARNDAKALPQAFDSLVTQTVVSRVDPTRYNSARAQRIPGATPGQPKINATQAAAEVKRIMNLSRIDTKTLSQALQNLSGGPITVSRSQSPVVDALLTQLGIIVK